MTTRPNLMQLDGTSSLGNMLGLAKSLIFRSHSVVQTKKITPTMPKRKGSVIAAVLADLLSGAAIDSIDWADELGTTRLKDQISNLRKRHGWEAIESISVARATADGRVQWVMQYFMPSGVIDFYKNEKTRIWINEVRSVRRNKRADVKGVERRAMRCALKKFNERFEAIESRMPDERGGA